MLYLDFEVILCKWNSTTREPNDMGIKKKFHVFWTYSLPYYQTNS